MDNLIDGGQYEDMWSPYKDLASVVGRYIGRTSPGSFAPLETVLRKHRQNFLSLMKNPPKSAMSRQEIQNGSLPPQLVSEAIIVSDMFCLDEVRAACLLTSASRQMPRHPGLPRGLVAVLLYYDGRHALAQTLRTIMAAAPGLAWTVEMAPGVVEYLASYVHRLVEDGVVQHILEVLETWDITSEMDLLQRNLALGGPKHRRQVLRLMQETRSLLAQAVACRAAQAGLPRAPALAVARAQRAPRQDDERGGADDVTVALAMAFLFAVDLSVINRREDGEELSQRLPVVSDPELLPLLGQEVMGATGAGSAGAGKANVATGTQALALFAWALAAANTNTVEGHDHAADVAINMKVFEYLHETFLLNETIYKEECYMKRLHTLYTDFIVLMHSKMMDLRLKADEAARTAQQYAAEGLEPPPTLPRHFEALLLGIASLYQEDKLNLRLHYWTTQDYTTTTPYRGAARGASLVKFVRSAGELAPARVLAPWARAVAALAAGPGAAARAHALLNPPQGTQPNQHLSFYHFFTSLRKYYSMLMCQDSGMMRRSVRSEEVVAMRAALQLVRSVVEHDAPARQAVCEHPAWSAVSVLIGLVGCSIPIPLKADLVLTLAALGTSPDTAAYIWNSLESAQLINTVPPTTSYLPCGVETELEEVEARNEEFPLTRALLRLFDALSTSGVPVTLGAGPRKPGFDPYLNFIVSSVFLRFPTRLYKSPEEKWQIAAQCLALFDKFQRQYEPSAADFPMPMKQNEINSPPGFHIMLQMNTKSDFLRLVLAILDESVTLLDTFQPFPGKRYLEDSALSCLSLLERSLSTQHVFMAELGASGCSILATGIGKLLLGINPRSGRPDHTLNIAKFVSYNSWLPKHALAAVNVLNAVALQPHASQHLVGVLTCDVGVRTEIRHGFVECLDAEECEDAVVTQTKEAIVNLLQSCLGAPAPNVSHYLLGFDLSKDVSKTAFHQPGVMGSPRTCLHSVVALLDAGIAVDSEESATQLREGSYKLLFLLCSKQNTLGPILRYLRSCNEFVCRHVASLRAPAGEDVDPVALSAAAWLLDLCAVELHVTACERQTSHFTALAAQLVQSPDKVSGGGALIRTLSALACPPPPPVEPSWRLLDATALAAARSACAPPGRATPVSVPALRRLLAARLSHTHPHPHTRLQEELDQALSHAVSLNRHALCCSSLWRLGRAWRCAAEALCCGGRSPSSSAPLLRSLLLTLHPAPPPPLADTLSGTVLMLLVSLRQGVASTTDSRHQTTMGGDAPPSSYCGGLDLNFVLQRLLSWLAASESELMRVNLYGALLNFMRMANARDVVNTQHNDTTYVSHLDSTLSRAPLASRSPVRSAVAEAVRSCGGDALLAVAGADAAGAAREVCRVAALAVLRELAELETDVPVRLHAQGHLPTLIDAMLKEDAALKQVLDVVPKTMKALFIYESKMSLFIRMASTRPGAELLLQSGLLGCLANMQALDCHPDMQASALGEHDSRDFIPSVASRFRQVLTPALALCDALVTTLGSENHSCLLQITHFLLSHLETVEAVLRAGTPMAPIGILLQLESLTSVIARASNQEIFGSVETETALQESIVSVYRIQKLMLALFPRFALSDGLLREMKEDTPTEENSDTDRVVVYFKVVCNLTCYARNITADHGVEHGSIGVVFRPALSSGGLDRGGQWAAPDSSPHLGSLVQQLVASVLHLDKERLTAEMLVRKASGADDDTSEGGDLWTRLNSKKKELEYTKFVVDNCLYLIWAHLDFYMLRAVPASTTTTTTFLNNATSNKSAVLTSTEAAFNSSLQDIADLKHGLVSVFNNTFCVQLLQAAADEPAAQKCFMEALLRKIKCLLQFVPVD